MRIANWFKKLGWWRKLSPTDYPVNLYVTGDHDLHTLTPVHEEMLERHLNVAEEYGVPFYFFTIPIWNHTQILSRVELGCHGLHHHHFDHLSRLQQYNLIGMARKQLGDPSFFRAPYLSMNRHTADVVALHGFKLDFTFNLGWPAKFFHMMVSPRKLANTVFIPCTTPSDSFFRRHGFTQPSKIFRFWREQAERILGKDGVVVLHLHPTVFDSSEALRRFLGWICENGLKN